MPLQTFTCVWHSEVTPCFYHRLSWRLMYAGLIFILPIFMALIITSIQIVVIVGFMVIFTLFFLYGLSLVSWQNISLNLFHISDNWVDDISSGYWFGIVTNLVSCFLCFEKVFDSVRNWLQLLKMILKGTNIPIGTLLPSFR